MLSARLCLANVGVSGTGESAPTLIHHKRLGLLEYLKGGGGGGVHYEPPHHVQKKNDPGRFNKMLLSFHLIVRIFILSHLREHSYYQDLN